MQATITFPNQDMAKSFTSFWSTNTLTGHTMSAKKQDGSFDVTVYDVDDNKKEMIDSYIANINSQPPLILKPD